MDRSKAGLPKGAAFMKYLSLFISFNVFAGFSDLSMGDYHYDFSKTKLKRIVKRKPKKIKSTSKINSLLDEIKNRDQAIEKMLLNNEKMFIVRKSQDKLKSLTRIKGILLNSVVATNRKTTTLIIKLDENEFFEDSEVRCLGLSYGKRVIGACDLVVTDKEYQVEAQLWDMDGAEGIISDQFYDGSEKEFLTSSFASFFAGVLDGAKDRIVTPFGESTRTNTKNKVLGGLMGIANNANSKIKQSADKNLQIALINSGKPVYVFFQKGVSL